MASTMHKLHEIEHQVSDEYGSGTMYYSDRGANIDEMRM